MRKKILLIYTGGTIGMNRSENGYAPQQGFLQEDGGYIWDGYRYVDLSYGHCVFPRLKARSADQRCPNWAACEEPRTPAAE